MVCDSKANPPEKVFISRIIKRYWLDKNPPQASYSHSPTYIRLVEIGYGQTVMGFVV